ncbi:hypothetical protein LMIY3S_03683 [Labrys miyagiensis]
MILLGKRSFASVALGTAAFLLTVPSLAAEDSSVTACKATGLLALQQKSSDITDLIIDQESVAVSAADTKVQDVPISTVVLGEAYIKKGKDTGKPDRFVCLIGEKGKVLLTFFTSK